MNKKIRIISIVNIAVFLVIAVSCASIPDDFVPKSITPVGKDQRILGSVNVQAVVPDVIKSKFYDPELAGFSNVSYGKLCWNEDNKAYEIISNKRSRVMMYSILIFICRLKGQLKY
jgi:hypothetical protein